VGSMKTTPTAAPEVALCHLVAIEAVGLHCLQTKMLGNGGIQG
jgi:hypothetical protein